MLDQLLRLSSGQMPLTAQPSAARLSGALAGEGEGYSGGAGLQLNRAVDQPDLSPPDRSTGSPLENQAANYFCHFSCHDMPRAAIVL